MQDSKHTCVPQLNLGPFCIVIGHLVWEKTDPIIGLKHLKAILSGRFKSNQDIKFLVQIQVGSGIRHSLRQLVLKQTETTNGDCALHCCCPYSGIAGNCNIDTLYGDQFYDSRQKPRTLPFFILH